MERGWRVMTATKTETPLRAPQPTARRNWIGIGLVLVLLVAASVAIGWWLGSRDDGTVETTAEVTSIAPEQVPAYVTAWGDALVNAETDGFRALYAGDGIYEDPIFGIRTSGAGVKAQAVMLFSTMTFNEMEPQPVLIGEDYAVVEWTFTGYASGDPAPTEPLVTAEMLTVFETDDGLISRSILYYLPDDFGA
jgi:hypothetical protein